MNIFRLDADIELFRPLAAPDEFFLRFPMGNFCTGLPMAKTWESIEMDELVEPTLVKAPNPPGNFSSFHLTDAIVLDEEAKSTLESDVTAADVEFLPLTFRGGQRWLLNVIDVIDALDERHSDVSRFSDGAIMAIQRYAFVRSRVQGHHIFKVPQTARAETYVSDAFATLIADSGMSGLRLLRIWSD